MGRWCPTFITHTQATVYFRLYGDQSGTYYSAAMNETNILGSNFRVFFEITNSGNSIRAGMSTLSAGDDIASTPFSEWSNNKKVNTGDQGFGITTREFIMMRSVVFNNTPALDLQDIDFTVLGEVAIPSSGLTTSWTKALDFSGSSERTQQVENNFYRCSHHDEWSQQHCHRTHYLRIHVERGYCRPWATAIVFSSDNNSSNQHIWNLGEGSGDNDDNIYLRVDSNRNLYFGWGRSGALNECSLGTLSSGSGAGTVSTSLTTGAERLSGSNATPVN